MLSAIFYNSKYTQAATVDDKIACLEAGKHVFTLAWMVFAYDCACKHDVIDYLILCSCVCLSQAYEMLVTRKDVKVLPLWELVRTLTSSILLSSYFVFPIQNLGTFCHTLYGLRAVQEYKECYTKHLSSWLQRCVYKNTCKYTYSRAYHVATAHPVMSVLPLWLPF